MKSKIFFKILIIVIILIILIVTGVICLNNLVAPYDCVITEINIPESGEKCTNEHYVKVASNNTLSVQFKVDETKVSSISLGQSANVSFSAFEDKSLEAVVTNVSSTASNGKFTVTVEFDNDGDVMLGMTAEVCL